MILFLEACADSGVLSVVFFVKKMLELIFIILPIILIVMILIDFTKNVMAKGDDDIKKNNRVVVKRIVYCIIAFFVPTIVNVVINAVYSLTSDGGENSNALSCWTEATKENIEYYRNLEEEERQQKENEKQQQNKEEYDSDTQEMENNKGTGGLSGKKEEETTNNGSTGGSSNVNDGSNLPSTINNFTIYVGDSRTHMMCIHAGVRDLNNKVLKENEDCITAPGKAYPWYSKDGYDMIVKAIGKHPMANIVINMGTNDVSPNLDQGANAPTHFAKKYAELHKKLANEFSMVKVVVVSITPFEETKSGAQQYRLTNDLVEKFNNTMKENISGSRIVFCDVTSKLSSHFSTTKHTAFNIEKDDGDGIHHNPTTSKKIYEEIRNCL